MNQWQQAKSSIFNVQTCYPGGQHWARMALESTSNWGSLTWQDLSASTHICMIAILFIGSLQVVNARTGSTNNDTSSRSKVRLLNVPCNWPKSRSTVDPLPISPFRAGPWPNTQLALLLIAHRKNTLTTTRHLAFLHLLAKSQGH
jgi:hypothetical protein